MYQYIITDKSLIYIALSDVTSTCALGGFGVSQSLTNTLSTDYQPKVIHIQG